jgi:hypothetical protein
MGLDATVYADADCENAIDSVRIGNLDRVVYLRGAIAKLVPEARVLLSKVLYDASHCGDSLSLEEVAVLRSELVVVRARSASDPEISSFVSEFFPLVEIAKAKGLPIFF